MGADTLRLAQAKIARLAGQQQDLVSFWRGVTAVLGGAVPHFRAPCFFTMDPASLLITSHFQEGLPEFPANWLTHEYLGDDVHQLADVGRSDRGISTLHEVTGGDPASSPRWHANMAYGGDQEMIAALRTRTGDIWGALSLYREPGRPLFEPVELAFIQAIAPALAEGVRRALLFGEATDPDFPDAPGLLILTGSGDVESVTPGTERWLADLPDGDWATGRLPSSVLAVAGQALRSVQHPGVPGMVAMSRVLSRTGTWVVLHGACLATTGQERVAVIVEPAHPGRISPLLMSAYGLTEREQELTRLVLQGNSTAEIATKLVLSAHTVQQHLQNVFDKTGVRSRRDLVGKIFFAHYEPRLRDNEQRAQHDRPLRGGPYR
ncbi:transcriptional regulator, LuxR family [Alloactinosynnema sp. L-07]|uniref:helix-turn-helix transcriptional regulator n=1 Tax=Alloactinosynnema sp. L-07 TaxID=1653480 RepID=UPI00065F036C|nr:helix-turn-helix transcriptional regulator [Alloactinosynnema sp. L-07]CRK62011.1 transcriptional regulator, LuxR family [Alloactinosynnema sp. L-07]